REVARSDHALAGARVGFTLLSHQMGNQGLARHVGLGLVFGLPADDQRCAGLVDQDGIHVVNNGEIQLALHTVTGLVHHVVAQVVETVFVVRAIGDVGVVGGLLFFA